jgi:AcrR family transcriptional regulator
MTPSATPVDSLPSSLVERKRRLVRERIVEAADELFSSQGFDNVSVSDIAARADVGRTTFFRYFGDKTEVVFAKEQAMLEAIALTASGETIGAARTPREAVEQLRPIVLEVCRQAAEDPAAYRRHASLVEQHLDLRARDALKTQQIAHDLAAVLQHRGTAEDVAVLAAEIALACYRTARRRATAESDLVRDTRTAFDQALAFGES